MQEPPRIGQDWAGMDSDGFLRQDTGIVPQ